jgi:mono/diheme cytochrome c family protein
MKHSTFRALALACATAALPLAAVSADAPPQQVQRGRYLALIGGCNDCHTEGYASSGGQVPEPLWLTGSALGSQGPWGTTYPVNLRLYMAGLSAGEWVHRARALKARPPMPWFVLRQFEEADLRALRAFIRSLGAAGRHAPAYLSPGSRATGPVIVFPAPDPKEQP